MNRPEHYLRIPADYGEWLGGLRWSASLEVVEDREGLTFAYGREIGRFLEGFASAAPLVHFAHVLHLLRLFGYGRLATDDDSLGLIELYLAERRPARNAGALAAYLSRRVPSLPDAPPVESILLQLNRGPMGFDLPEPARGPRPLFDPGPDVVWDADQDNDPPIAMLMRVRRDPGMYLHPDEFGRRVSAEASSLTRAEIRHWLRHGRGPVESAEDLVREIEPRRAQSVTEALDEAIRRPRLAGGASMVARFEGALSLPPRQRWREIMPTGGYADLANHGHPERLLPAQFGLDAEEFLRRFAERELLYYHREEPRTPEPEELVLLIDQGVRTWGVVRLVLGAAAVAIGRMADRRKIRVGIATTARSEPVDPSAIDPEELGTRLEGSDLTENPSAALRGLLEIEPETGKRDIVVLSHPRALADPAMEAAAREVPEGTRLFSVSVDDQGRVQFNEVRGGRSVALCQFRADFDATAPKARREAITAQSHWAGDVEPIGLPFRVRPLQSHQGPRPMFAFDGAGSNLVTIDAFGFPVLRPIDGSPPEILPRAFCNGSLLRRPLHMIGTDGGFVLVGQAEPRSVQIAWYDLRDRRVRAFVAPTEPGPLWYVAESPELLVSRHSHATYAYRMRTGERIGFDSSGLSTPEIDALRRASEQTLPPDQVVALHDRDTLPASGSLLRLSTSTGELHLHGLPHFLGRIQPLSDGKPRLAGLRIRKAVVKGDTLALDVRGSDAPQLLLFRSPGEPLPEHTSEGWGSGSNFELSPDGRLIAISSKSGRVTVHEVNRPGQVPLHATTSEPPETLFALGEDWLAIRVDTYSHTIRWDGECLGHRVAEDPRGEVYPWRKAKVAFGSPVLGLSRPGKPPVSLEYDNDRFPQKCDGFLITAVMDVHGQVVLLNSSGEVLAMFYAVDDQVAGWLPDGTRFGSPTLGGAPPTADAPERFVRRLRSVRVRGGSK